MSLFRILRSRPAALLLLGLLPALGCSSDDPVPICENCGFWTQVSSGLARFPEPHPLQPDHLLLSTVDKTPGAPDADRDSDEDIWLLLRGADAQPTGHWQLTDDALGDGDNFDARWSPSGTQIAFVHTSPAGRFEVWRMPVSLPATPGDPPVLGPAELVVSPGRDPAWVTETRLLFTRDSKLYRVDLPPGAGPPTSASVQLTFNPPLFASTEVFVDRHPVIAPDGGGVLNTIGRRNSADVRLRAFEIDELVFPPDTTETRAWISYESPEAADPSYPIFIGLDTLRTPITLRSIPVGAGGTYDLGVRLDSRFLPDSVQAYCDTTITASVTLQGGDVDTVSYYFRVIRGTMTVRTGVSRTDLFWTRQDARETIFDYTPNTRIDVVGGSIVFDCIMPFAVNDDGSIDLARPETLIVTGTRGSLSDQRKVLVNPGETTLVSLFPTGGISGTVSFSDSPTTRPVALVQAFVAGTSEIVSSALSGTTIGAYRVPDLPGITYDVLFQAANYRDTTIVGVSVTPGQDVVLPPMVMTRVPGPASSPGPDLASVPAPASSRARVESVAVARRASGAASPLDNAASYASVFRAEGDETTVWRLDVDPTTTAPPVLAELFGSPGLIQHPALTTEFGGGVRYVAYASNENGQWELFVQRLVNWAADGSPVRIETPGSSDNLSCDRAVFHPRWVPGTSPGNLRLLVAMSDCPDNGFEDLGFDDDPWAVGEVRVWEVSLPEL